jgi:murein biosynthesis integral membrane protein MurJ
LGKNILNVFGFSLFCQAVGYLRILIIAALFGASSALDAYYLALIVPAFVSGVVGGALQASFVPLYIDLLTSGDTKGAAALRGAVFWLVGCLLCLLAVALSTCAPAWTDMMVPSGMAAQRQLTIEAGRVLVFALPFTGIFDYLALVLNSHKRFVLASAAPVANAAVSIPALLIIGPDLAGLVWSLILGSIAQLLFLVPGLWSVRLNLPLNYAQAKPHVRRTLRLALPMVPGFVFTQLQLAIVQALPARLGEGAVSIFGYATRLQGLVEQTFVLGMGTVLLPHLAEMVSQGNRPALERTLRQVFGYALLGSAALELGLLLGGADAIFLLFGRGSFDRALAERVAEVWIWLALATFPFAVSTALSKLIMVLQRPALLTWVAALLLVITAALGQILPDLAGLRGVAMVFVATQSARLVAYWALLRSRLGRRQAG